MNKLRPIQTSRHRFGVKRNPTANNSSWVLPPNTGNDSYANLMTSTISGIPVSSGGVSDSEWQVYTDQFVQSPLSFALSGNYNYYGGLGTQGYNGYYWSRTASSTNNAYNFRFYTNGDFNIRGNSNNYNGFAVRCVLIP